MKFIRQNRTRWGEAQFRLVVQTEDGTQIKGRWASDDAPSIVDDASIEAGTFVEVATPGPGYALFDADYTEGDRPALMRYTPAEVELHEQDLPEDDEDSEDEDEDTDLGEDKE